MKSIREHIITFFLLLAALGASAAAEDILIVGSLFSNDPKRCSPLLFDGYRQAGWKGNVRLVDYQKLTRDDLLSAKLVIVDACGRNLSLDPHQRQLLTALVEYVRAGGGLVIHQNAGQMFNYMVFRWELFKALGGQSLLESAQVPRERWTQLDKTTDELSFTVTDRAMGPFAKGVSRVAFQPKSTFGNFNGNLAFLPTDEWKVALTAGKDIPGFVCQELGYPPFNAMRREKSFAGDVPLVGYRQFGRGRAVWFGAFFEPFTRTTHGENGARVMKSWLADGLREGEKVDTGRFIYQMFDWVSENSGTIDSKAIPALLTSAEYDKKLGLDYHYFRGVVGPRTIYSSGHSTVAEYVAKAKSLGLDFIVFLEEFDKLTLENYEKLYAECAKFTDDKFTAIAGYTYENSDGNGAFAFGFDPLYPGKAFLTPDGKRIVTIRNSTCAELEFFYSMLGFNNQRGWYKFKLSPYALTDTRNVQSIAYLTRVNGVLSEVADAEWKANARTGQQLIPYALELMDDVKYLNERSWISRIGRPGLSAFRQFITSFQSYNEYPNEGAYGKQSITSGPEVNFSLQRADMRADGRLLYDPILDRAAYTLEVSSSVGLDTIELYDSDTCLRRWKANGEKTFSRRDALVNERQHYFWIKATDVKGGYAISRASNTQSFLLRESMCNDRNNQLLYSEQPRANGEPSFLGSYGADTALPDKGPWCGRVRPLGFYVFDKKYGVGSWGGSDGSPEDHPKVNFVPSVWYGGNRPRSFGWVPELVSGHEGGAHNIPQRVIASSNALVGDRYLDGTFPTSVSNVVNVWRTLAPVLPSHFVDTRARCTLFLPKPDGAIAYQWEQALTLKSAVPAKKGEPIAGFGTISTSRHLAETTAWLDGQVLSNALHKTFRMKRGDFIFLRDSFFGSLAVYALEPVTYRARSFTVEADAAVMPAGTTYPFRMAMVAFHKFTKDPFASAQELAESYGLVDGRTGYQVTSYAGSAVPNGVCLDACAAKGAYVGRIDGLCALPTALGLRLSGLADNRVAVLARADGAMRIVPVENGTAYIALRNEESDQVLFAGHPFTCSAREVCLALSRNKDKKWRLEIHNPTDRAIKTLVATDPRFKAFAFSREVELAAGSSVDVDLDATPVPQKKVSFVVIDPGHFHAALPLNRSYEGVARDVHVFAPKGADLDAHLKLVSGFNAREKNPTDWKEIVHAGPDFLNQFKAFAKSTEVDPAQTVVILAGRNAAKADYAIAAVQAGFNVLADKPLAIDRETLGKVEKAQAIAEKSGLLFSDIMTERFEITALLQKALVSDRALYGVQEKGTAEDPAIVKESVHHFCKFVDGKPLTRPTWYYDTAVQGEGIVDVTTHIVDLIQWAAFPGRELEAGDVVLKRASTWPTPISAADYKTSTGSATWPASLKKNVDSNGVLQCRANGEFVYSLCDVFTKVRVVWNFTPPKGSGDTHASIMRGTKAEVAIRQNEKTGWKQQLFVRILSGEGEKAVHAACERLSVRWPGVRAVPTTTPNEWRISYPTELDIGHEAHFSLVMKEYLEWLRAGGMPEERKVNLKTKLRTLIDARELARKKQ